MRSIPMDTHTVIRGGLEWPFGRLPSTKEMLQRLERNEAFISWLQPNGGGVSLF